MTRSSALPELPQLRPKEKTLTSRRTLSVSRQPRSWCPLPQRLVRIADPGAPGSLTTKATMAWTKATGQR